MNKMDDKHRYYPYYQRKNCNNDDFNQQYDRHNQRSSSSYDNRLNKQNYMDFSEQSKSKTYSYLPPPSLQPLMASKTMPQATTLLTAIPHERESWIRSVKKTKINESTEQKTQYLETMLRMPQQQKSSLNSSRFDRIRFANDQMSITTNTTENNNLDQNSFHLISNINSHDEICAIEKLLFDIEPQPTTKDSSNPILLSSPIINCEESTIQANVEFLPYSGFLINNCDEEELPSRSPPFRSPLPCLSATEELIPQSQDNLHQQRAILVNEFNAADDEQRLESYRQKRLRQRLRRRNKRSNQSKTKINDQQIIDSEAISIVNNKDSRELLSDWIIEYNGTETDLTTKTSPIKTDENKIAKVNIILKKIKKQQKELTRLRKYILSILGDEEKRNLTNPTQQNPHMNQDLLMKILNQPIPSGCWLCSGKLYTEVDTQCDNIDE